MYFCGVALAGLERDQDLAVGVGDGGVLPKARLMPPLGRPMLSRMSSISLGRDDLADLFFDGGEVLLGVFEAHAFGRVDVQAHLAGVDVGEEVLRR